MTTYIRGVSATAIGPDAVSEQIRSIGGEVVPRLRGAAIGP